LVKQIPAQLLGNHCSPAPLAAVVYFCSFVLLCGLVLVNFVIGVIIDNMQSSNNSEDMPISRQHVERFTRVSSVRVWGSVAFEPPLQLQTRMHSAEWCLRNRQESALLCHAPTSFARCS
jgi:hypothetical protein